jgi:pimeloyl-ACP methyl ester carboxylesterase
MYWIVAGGALILLLAAYNYFKVKQAERRYPPGGSFITVNGVRLHYYSEGEEGAPPVVFLHGGVLTGNDYRQVVAMAREKGYRAFAFDRPGYGYSDRPKAATPEEQARLIRNALEKLGAKRPIIVGHSWSGLLALAYALQYPDEVAGIVTLGGAMYAEGYPAGRGDVISIAATAPLMGPFLLHTMLAVIGPLLSNLMIKASFTPESVPPPYRSEAKALWLRPRHFRANREDVMHFVPAATRLSGQYKGISVPLIIAAGEDDPFETREHSYRLHQEVGHSQLLVWNGVAHMIPQLHPSLVWEAVLKMKGRREHV